VKKTPKKTHAAAIANNTVITGGVAASDNWLPRTLNPLTSNCDVVTTARKIRKN